MHEEGVWNGLRQVFLLEPVIDVQSLENLFSIGQENIVVIFNYRSSIIRPDSEHVTQLFVVTVAHFAGIQKLLE